MTLAEEIGAMIPGDSRRLSRAQVIELIPYLEATRNRAIRDNFEVALAIADCLGSFEAALADEMFL